jgi:hypothetical protein
VRLFDITEQYRELQLLAEDPQSDSTAIADTLEGIEGVFQDKARAVAAVIGNLTADADAIEAAAGEMRKRAAALRSRVDAIKTYLLINMQACNYTKISCPYFTISLRDNPPHVEVLDAAAVPDSFRVWPEVPPPSIDKRALLAALKAGETVPGVRLERGQRVEIKS